MELFSFDAIWRGIGGGMDLVLQYLSRPVMLLFMAVAMFVLWLLMGPKR